MTDFTHEGTLPVQPLPRPDSLPEPLPVNNEGLVKFALDAHRQFDDNIWRNNSLAQVKIGESQIPSPSYHNHHHIDAMKKATKSLITACRQGIDPLGLMAQLAEWNSRYPLQEPLTLEDLEIALEIASAGHDLGNITKSASVRGQNGLPFLDFSDKYELEGLSIVETRSADIIEKLIDHFFTTADEKAKMERLKPLVRHLIMQTVFDSQVSESSQPFWLFMQYADQIGTYFFPGQPRPQSIAGLLNEMRVRSDPPPPNLAGFLNFPEERAKALVPDANMKSKIEEIMKEAGGNSSNLNSAGLIGDTDRPVDYLQDIISLIAHN